jgi:hypothetical protein
MQRKHRSLPPALLLGLILAGCGDPEPTGPRPAGTTNPENALLVYEDIPRFWMAFDKMRSAGDTMPMRVDYLDRGTIGLRDFTAARWRTAANLTAMVWPRRAYYASIRQNTLNLSGNGLVIRAAFRELARIYPASIFPNVYFTIGGLSTGGTTSVNGLLIGVELYTRAENSPTDELSVWQRSVIRTADVLPAIVAHELIHYQQRYPAQRTLLEQSIAEGSADFLGELLTGRTINEHIEAYAAPREQQIWQEFRAVMNGTDVSMWLYNGGTATGDRPADLGYWIGARISKAYYDRAADKSQAVRDILNIQDFAAFLNQSGYADKF